MPFEVNKKGSNKTDFCTTILEFSMVRMDIVLSRGFWLLVKVFFFFALIIFEDILNCLRKVIRGTLYM